jgi:hypothetical protein
MGVGEDNERRGQIGEERGEYERMEGQKRR